MLPAKYEIIMVPSNHSNFQYCDTNIGLFSIDPCKVITLNPLHRKVERAITKWGARLYGVALNERIAKIAQL